MVCKRMSGTAGPTTDVRAIIRPDLSHSLSAKSSDSPATAPARDESSAGGRRMLELRRLHLFRVHLPLAARRPEQFQADLRGCYRQRPRHVSSDGFARSKRRSLFVDVNLNAHDAAAGAGSFTAAGRTLNSNSSSTSGQRRISPQI